MNVGVAGRIFAASAWVGFAVQFADTYRAAHSAVMVAYRRIAFCIAIAFMVCGYAIVWIDRQVGTGRQTALTGRRGTFPNCPVTNSYELEQIAG